MISQTIESFARNTEGWADETAFIRRMLDELHDEHHPAFPHLARAERRLHEAAAEILAAADAYTENRASA